ncbi:MAG: hypothetical protein RL071_141 [Pseudomonadota bacterium]
MSPSQSLRPLVAGALLSLLGGCAALGPNLTGGWSGACTTYTPTGDVAYALELDLEDDRGEVTGEGDAEITDPLLGEFFVELMISGARKNSGAALEAKGKEQGRLDLEGELSDQTFEGTCVVGEDWGPFELKRR